MRLENVIEIKHVSKTFANALTNSKASLNALDDVSFSVSRGETVAILGLNGSGKTTLLRIIAGIFKPDAGTVSINGKIAPMLSIGTGFQGDLDAHDNIVIYGLLLGLSKSHIEKKISEILEYAELESFAQMKLKNYSTGMKLRLAFSTAIQVDFDILLIDEAFAVGDRVFRKKSQQVFENLRKEKKTILFSTHSLDNLAKKADRAILLEKGRLVADDSIDKVIEIYKNRTVRK